MSIVKEGASQLRRYSNATRIDDLPFAGRDFRLRIVHLRVEKLSVIGNTFPISTSTKCISNAVGAKMLSFVSRRLCPITLPVPLHT